MSLTQSSKVAVKFWRLLISSALSSCILWFYWSMSMLQWFRWCSCAVRRSSSRLALFRSLIASHRSLLTISNLFRSFVYSIFRPLLSIARLDFAAVTWCIWSSYAAASRVCRSTCCLSDSFWSFYRWRSSCRPWLCMSVSSFIFSAYSLLKLSFSNWHNCLSKSVFSWWILESSSETWFNLRWRDSLSRLITSILSL